MYYLVRTTEVYFIVSIDDETSVVSRSTSFFFFNRYVTVFAISEVDRSLERATKRSRKSVLPVNSKPEVCATVFEIVEKRDGEQKEKKKKKQKNIYRSA